MRMTLKIDSSLRFVDSSCVVVSTCLGHGCSNTGVHAGQKVARIPKERFDGRKPNSAVVPRIYFTL